MKTLFLYLTAFAGTGGIEKFNRAFMKALCDLHQDDPARLQILSVYDTSTDPRYAAPGVFRGFTQKKARFAFQAVRAASSADTIILGHINLAPVGLLIKRMFPGKQVLLVAHGIEVWRVTSPVQRAFIRKADHILAVSEYTRTRMLQNDPALNPRKIQVFYNTLDPYFAFPTRFGKPGYLLQRYGFAPETKIILTIARLSDTEKYKGYDKVIEALPGVLRAAPGAVYLLCGKYRPAEKERVDDLIRWHGLEKSVVVPGFVKDEELIDHYLLADVFVMPSKNEGFGIVFIEALACGLPVIAGNQDGSVEALRHGELGILVNPEEVSEIGCALTVTLTNPATDKAHQQAQVAGHFGFKPYKQRLRNLFTPASEPLVFQR